MAEGWLRQLGPRVGVASAGIVGGTAVKAGAVTVMAEACRGAGGGFPPCWAETRSLARNVLDLFVDTLVREPHAAQTCLQAILRDDLQALPIGHVWESILCSLKPPTLPPPPPPSPPTVTCFWFSD